MMRVFKHWFIFLVGTGGGSRRVGKMADSMSSTGDWSTFDDVGHSAVTRTCAPGTKACFWDTRRPCTRETLTFCGLFLCLRPSARTRNTAS